MFFPRPPCWAVMNKEQSGHPLKYSTMLLSSQPWPPFPSPPCLLFNRPFIWIESGRNLVQPFGLATSKPQHYSDPSLFHATKDLFPFSLRIPLAHDKDKECTVSSSDELPRSISSWVLTRWLICHSLEVSGTSLLAFFYMTGQVLGEKKVLFPSYTVKNDCHSEIASTFHKLLQKIIK